MDFLGKSQDYAEDKGIFGANEKKIMVISHSGGFFAEKLEKIHAKVHNQKK